MATRESSARYAANAAALRGQHGGQGDNSGGIGGLLAALTGQNSISGGDVQTTPEGGIGGYTPFRGSKGFFGAASRARAAELNAQVMLSTLASI